MKRNRGITRFLLGILPLMILVWSLSSVSFAKTPTAKDLKWGGTYGMTAQWDEKVNEDSRSVYVQLLRNGEAVTEYLLVSKFDDSYDFGSIIADEFCNGTYTFRVKIHPYGVNVKESISAESPQLKLNLEQFLGFKDQSPVFPADQTEPIIRVKVGDTVTFKFNNVPLPEPLAEKYYVSKDATMSDWTSGNINTSSSGNYHDHIPVEFKYTFTESGAAYFTESISFLDKNFASSSYEKKGYTYSISRKYSIVVEPKPCVHDYQELSNTATCTSPGERNLQCHICGDAVTEYVSARGHDVITSYQYDAFTHWNACDICYVSVNEQKHLFDKFGSCITCGYNKSCEADYMSHCSDDKFHWYACEAMHSGDCPSNNVLEKDVHQIINDPEPGQSAYSCQNGYVCKECLWYYGPKGQHKWVLDEQSSVPATYASEGKAVYRCVYDGMRDGRNYVINCGEVKTVILKKLTHSWDYAKVLKNTATCTKDGKKTIGCKDNGCKETMLIDSLAMGHKYNSDDVCETCGYKNTAVKTTADPIVMTETKTKAKYELDKRDKTSGSVLFLAPKNKKITKFTIPEAVIVDGMSYRVTGIAVNAFQGCKKLKSVSIGKYVNDIGMNAFSGCTQLKKVAMGKNVVTIGDSAFAKCKSLQMITIPAKTKTIGNAAFYGCSKLKTVTLGKNVKTIGEKAFYKCTALQKIIIPSKVTYIGKEAFYACKKLNSIKISTMKIKSDTVGEKAFAGIHAKANVRVPAKKVKVYKKLLRQKGMGKKVKIAKN